MSWDDSHPDDILDNLGVDRYEFHDAELLGWKNSGPESLQFNGEVIHPSDERWEELRRRRDEERRLKEEARREERQKKEREWDEQYWREQTVGMTEEEKEEFEKSFKWQSRWDPF